VAYHSKEEFLRDVNALGPQAWVDGVYFDVPKRRRREQAMGTREVRIQWPKDQKKRFVAQYNRYVEILTKDIGIEELLKRLEAPSDEELRKLTEDAPDEVRRSSDARA
jgi:hypothetical protein